MPRPYWQSSDVRRDHQWAPLRMFGAEDTGVYYPRLERDGWTLTDRLANSEWDAVTIFEKPIVAGWLLRKFAHEQVGAPPGKGCYWDEHELIRPGGESLMFPHWEWADVDGEQLVWAEHGCLFRGSVSGGDPVKDKKLLHDFAAFRFAAIEAPY